MREKLLQEYNDQKEIFDHLDYKISSIIYDIAGKVEDARTSSWSHSYDSFEIENDQVVCKWHDYWGYGGEDRGTTKFPLSLFLNPETIEDYIKELDAQEAAALKKCAEQQVAEAKARLEYYEKQL